MTKIVYLEPTASVLHNDKILEAFSVKSGIKLGEESIFDIKLKVVNSAWLARRGT